MKRNHHKYWVEELAGRAAQLGATCPYTHIQLGRRCAWLAGYRDAHPES